MFTRLRFGGSVSKRSPAIQISPASGLSNPAINRSSVVFPDPLSPEYRQELPRRHVE